MKRTFSVLIFSALFFISANSASALTVAEQIALLQTQIAELQAQLEALIHDQQTQTPVQLPIQGGLVYPVILYPEISDNTSCLELQYNMRRGARDAYTNGEVTKLQNFLRTVPESKWPSNQFATGYFGYVTERAVANFQLHHGLVTSTFSSVAGSVGPITRAKIKEVSCVNTGGGNNDPDFTQNYTISVSTDKTIYDTDENILITTVVTNNSNNSLPITFNTGCETEVTIKNVNTGATRKSVYEYCTQSIRTTSVSGNSSRAWQDKFQNYYEGLPAGTYVAVIGVGNLGERQTNSFTIQNLDNNGDSGVDINAYLGVSFNLYNNKTAGLSGTNYRIKYVQGEINCVTTPCYQPDPKLIVTNSSTNYYQEISIASGSSKQIPGTPYYVKILSKTSQIGGGHVINLILDDSSFVDSDTVQEPSLDLSVIGPSFGYNYLTASFRVVAKNIPYCVHGTTDYGDGTETPDIQYSPCAPYLQNQTKNIDETFTHEFANPGVYNVVVTYGNLSDSVTITVAATGAEYNPTESDSSSSSNQTEIYQTKLVTVGQEFTLLDGENATISGTGHNFKYVQSINYCFTAPCYQPNPDIIYTNNVTGQSSKISLGYNEVKPVPNTTYELERIGYVGYDATKSKNKVTLKINEVSQDNSINPSIQIISPNGGEVYAQGQVMNITWSAVDMPSEGVLGLSFVNQVTGVNYYPLPHCGSTGANCVDISTGSYQLTIPNTVDAGTYKLRLYCALPNSESYCKGTSIGYEDYSNGSFVVYGSSEYPQTSVVLSATPTSGVAPLTVTFNVVATDILTCSGSTWTFGDGVVESVTPYCGYTPTTYNSFTDTKTHTYTQAGTYTVTASYGSANDSVIITVTDPSVLRGDVNLDGLVNLGDVIVAVRYVEGLTTLTQAQIEAGDLDNDGDITQWDTVNLNRIILGLPEVSFLLGDVNLDGSIDVADALLALRHYEGLQTLSTAGKLSADIDSNGVIDLRDVQNILRLAVGLETQNFIIGDINHDGVVDLTDIVKINRYVAGLEQLDALQVFLADVNLDGVVNSVDVQQASNLAVGLPVVY